MNGAGIFSKFKRAVKKAGKKISRGASKVARDVKDAAKDGRVQNIALDVGLGTAAGAAGAVNPALGAAVAVGGEQAKRKITKGKGVFGKIRKVAKKVAKGAQGFAKKPIIANALEHGIGKVLDTTIDTVAASAKIANPELAPAIDAGKDRLKKDAKKQVGKSFKRGRKPKVEEQLEDIATGIVETTYKPLSDYGVEELRKALEKKLGKKNTSPADDDEIEGNGLYYAKGRGLNSMGLPDSVQSLRHLQSIKTPYMLQQYHI